MLRSVVNVGCVVAKELEALTDVNRDTLKKSENDPPTKWQTLITQNVFVVGL